MSNLPTIPTDTEFRTMKELGAMAIKSNFLPASIQSVEQAVIIMLKGRELGIPAMQAFSGISVINGKPAIGAELMLALVYQRVPGVSINYIQNDANACEIKASRPGSESSIFSFTMEDAKRAKLAGKASWIAYPASMLRARCISAMCRAMFPDAIAGASYTPEELEDTSRDVTPEIAVSQNATEKPRTEPAPPKNQARLVQAAARRNWKHSEVRAVIQEGFGKQTASELTDLEMDELIDLIDRRTGEDAIGVIRATNKAEEARAQLEAQGLRQNDVGIGEPTFTADEFIAQPEPSWDDLVPNEFKRKPKEKK